MKNNINSNQEQFNKIKNEEELNNINKSANDFKNFNSFSEGNFINTLISQKNSTLSQNSLNLLINSNDVNMNNNLNQASSASTDKNSNNLNTKNLPDLTNSKKKKEYIGKYLLEKMGWKGLGNIIFLFQKYLK